MRKPLRAAIALVSALAFALSPALAQVSNTTYPTAHYHGATVASEIATFDNTTGRLVSSGYQIVPTIAARSVWSNMTSGVSPPVDNTQLVMGGSVSAPPYSFAGTATTGIYSSSSNVISMATSGFKLADFRLGAGNYYFDIFANSTPTIRAAQGALSAPVDVAIAGFGTNGTGGGVSLYVNGSSASSLVATFQSSASAAASTNSFKFLGVANGSAPSINMVGSSDTDVSLNVVPKGSGTLQVNASPVVTQGNLGTGVYTFLGTPSGANLASALTTALPITKGGTGSTTGQTAAAALSLPYVVANDGATHSTVSTTEAALAACDIPAGIMGANGVLEVDVFWDAKGSTVNTVTIYRIAAGSGTGTTGTALTSTTLNTNNTVWSKFMVRNNNSASAQITNGTTWGMLTNSTTAYSTAAINTANAWTFRINGDAPTGNGTTDTLSIKGLSCRVVQAAGT